VIGKSLGGATTAMIQGLIIMLISLFLGVHLQFGSILLLLAFMFLISLAFVALGVAIASRMQDMQGFQLVMNFLIMPVFLLSGALFPLSTAPGLLKTISLFDPLTYGVEGLRAILLGSSEISLAASIAVIAVIAIALTAIAAWFFGKIEE
jgi:ABC-2 type transport system permease protein